MRVFYLVAVHLATILLANGEDTDCPTTCKCDKSGTSGILAECSALDASQYFGIEIASLDLSNIPELELPAHIFTNVGLKRVSSIKIVNSELKTIDVNAFSGLHNLNDLNLTGNHLSLLEPDMFANNMHLERLSLSQNPLQFMQVDPSPYEGYFLSIPSLQELDISNCALSHLLPTMFTKLTTLVYINLANNEITEIPNGTFAQLVDLEEVNLSNNKITSLTPEMFQFNTELTELNLRNNPLTTVSGIAIPSLQKLDISQCAFKNIDAESFIGFTYLKNLNLSGNAITTIPPDTFNLLKKLLYLDLSNNNLIGNIPDDLFMYNIQLETIKLQNNPEMKILPGNGFQGAFSELYLLDMSNCGLSSVENNAFKGMNHLSFLNLSNNEIEYIKPGALNQKIVHLDLSNNKIVHLDQVSFPQKSMIRKLYLSGNPLKKLSPNNFINVTRLTKLYMKSCELDQLWDLTEDNETTLNNLVYLNVADNKIKSLTIKDLSYIQRVQTLVLSNNPLSCDEDLKKALKYLTDKGVASSDATERKESEELRMSDSVDSVVKDELGWKSFMSNICKENQKYKVDPSYDPSYESITEDEEEEEEEATETSYNGDPNIDTWGTDSWDFAEVISNYPDDEIQKELVYQSRANYMWPIIIVSLSGFAIILGLLVLAAFFLRWRRQKNSYRNRIIKRHSLCTTPKLKRDARPIYQPLREESSPPTPIMSSKQVADKSSQDVSSSTVVQPNASYRIGSFHHSNIVPESV